VSQERWTAVDRYVTDVLVGDDPIVDRAGLPAHDVTAPQGKLLYLLARSVGARTILELGTLGGYSTIWLARALPDDGRLVTLEVDDAYAQVARANLARAGLDHIVDVRVGDALETLPQLDGQTFDVIFIDADKRSNPEYLAWALNLARRGTLIVADNIVRDAALLDPGDDASAAGARRFVELLAAEPRVEATVIQTVGGKGHDGFALALVTADE
jgi:predicted O-methyltransferase YrrM